MALGAEVFRLFGSIGVDTSEAEQGLDNVAQRGRRAAEDLDNNTGGRFKSFGVKSAAVMGAIAGAAQAAFSKIASVVTSTIEGAVRRVDTLNNANLVFKNMGFSADDTKTAMTRLKDSIQGLPTALNDAVTGVQALAATSGDLKGAQQVYQAINDGILAFGGSAEQVSGSITQLSQLPLDGPLDAETWLSLRDNGMTPVFAAMAKDSGRTMAQLKEDFSKGTLTVGDFNNMLIKLDKDGGGGMASLQKQAHDATSGIATGWTNMQTAITRGMADIIQAIGSKNISTAISSIGTQLEKFLKGVGDAITFIEAHQGVFKTISAGLLGIVAALALFRAIEIVSDIAGVFTAFQAGTAALRAYETSSKLAAAAQWLLNAAMSANPIAIIVIAVAGLVAALVYFFTQTTLGRQIVANFLRFMQEAWTNIANFTSDTWHSITKFISDAITNVINWVKANWPLLVGLVTGPLGLLVSLIVKNFDQVKKFISDTLNNIKLVWEAAWNGILTALKVAWDGILKFLTLYIGIPLAIINTFLIQPLIAIWNGLWPYLHAALVAAWNGITTAVTVSVNAVQTAITTAVNFIVSAWRAAWGAVSDFFVRTWTAIVTFFTPILLAIQTALTTALNFILTVWQTIWTTLSNFFITVWNQMVAFFTPILLAIQTALTTALNFILTVWMAIWTTVTNFFITTWNAIVAFIVPILTTIQNIIITAFNAIKNAITTTLNAAHSAVVATWNAITNTISSAVNWVKNTVSSGFNSAKNATASAWEGIKNAIAGPMNTAKNLVKGAIDAIRSFFNFHISWPHVPLPHFSIQPRGWSIGDLLKGKIPSLGISWYAKGGILDGPTLFGLNGNNLMGGGEAGQEAVLPLNRDTLGGIGHGIAATMGAGNDSALLRSLLDEVKQLRKDQANTQLVMDTGALVGAIRKEVDRQLQNDSTLRLRGVTT